MYVAKTYIGGKYAPGEIIRDELPADTRDWLLKSGAIKVAPDYNEEPTKAQMSPMTTGEKTEPKGEAEDEQTGLEDEPEDATEDEAEDEPEPLTIDPMEAVIPAKSAEAPKTTGKTSGRRKTK